jgi:hypothetical protein
LHLGQGLVGDVDITEVMREASLLQQGGGGHSVAGWWLSGPPIVGRCPGGDPVGG